MRSLTLLTILTMLFAMAGDYRAPAAVPVEDVFVCADDGSLAPAQLTFDERACKKVSVSHVDPQHRSIWLRTNVIVPEELGPPLGVRVSAMASTSIFWNGRLLGSNGTPSLNAESEIAGLMDGEIFLPQSEILKGGNLLAIRMSAHAMPIRVGTPVHIISIGPYGRLRAAMLEAYLPALFMSGAMVLAAIYFFAAFLFDRREKSALALAVMTLFVEGQLVAESARGLFQYDYPFHVPRLLAITLFAGLAGISLNAFIVFRFAVKRPWLWISASIIGAIATFTIVPLLFHEGLGFDGRTVLIVAVAAVIGLTAAVTAARRGAVGARLLAGVLGVYLVLIFSGVETFLDRDYYLVIFVLLGILFVDQVLAMRRDRMAREAAQTRADLLELELLRRGMAPHFLLNTLNSLTEWVESEPQTGVRMIHALADHMRNLAAIGQKELIPLSRELELVRGYLSVMSFRNDAPFELIVEGDVAEIFVPPGVLHTLAENGFTHNRYPLGGQFALKVSHDADRVVLTFETPASPERRVREGSGEGLAFVRARINAVSQGQARFQDGACENGEWRSTIVWPRRVP